MAEILKNQVFSKEQRQKRNYLIHLLYVRKEFDDCLLLIEDTLAQVNEVSLPSEPFFVLTACLAVRLGACGGCFVHLLVVYMCVRACVRVCVHVYACGFATQLCACFCVHACMCVYTFLYSLARTNAVSLAYISTISPPCMLCLAASL